MHWRVSHNDIISLDFLGSVSFKAEWVLTLKFENLGSWVKILERKVPFHPFMNPQVSEGC